MDLNTTKTSSSSFTKAFLFSECFLEPTRVETWSSSQELAQSLALYADQINSMQILYASEKCLSGHLTDVHTSH